MVLADDLGHANVGFHRHESQPPPEVATPWMDQLARSGMILNRHYVHKMCTPSRSSLISGRLPVHCTESLRLYTPNSGIPRNVTGIGHVLRRAGYATHQVGKWGAGGGTPTHTPRGRGFDTSLGYFDHKNDFWSRGIMSAACPGAFGNLSDLWDTSGPASRSVINGDAYEEAIFRDRVLSIIAAHDQSKRPLFLLYTPHVAHSPLQAPQAYIDRFYPLTASDDEGACRSETRRGYCAMCYGPTPNWPAAKPYRCRALYSAMVSFLDDVVGRVAAALRDKRMYERTLLVFSSDNGGSVKLSESAANNYPYRGGKYADFEGGVRAAAFVAGGLLPSDLRGTTSEVVMHLVDWYATFAALAGLAYPTDHAAAASGLPPLDSVNAWPALTARSETGDGRFAAAYTHAELPLSRTALLDARSHLKLLRGKQHPAGWQGPRYPNASSRVSSPNFDLECGRTGCLFNVSSDPYEHINLAGVMPEVARAMSARLDQLAKSFFENRDNASDACPAGVLPPNVKCACWMARHKYGGTMGPFQEVEL